MKKILFSLMAIALVAGLVGAGAFALFSDTETSEDNTFAAGTLYIKINGEDDGASVWSFESPDAGLKPTDTDEYTFVIQNTGSLVGLLNIDVGPYSEAAGAYPEPEANLQAAGIADLDSELHILFWQDDDGDNVFDDGEDVLLEGKVSAVLDPEDPVNILTDYELGSTDIKNLGFVWLVQDADDINKIMGDSVVFDIVFSIVQK